MRHLKELQQTVSLPQFAACLEVRVLDEFELSHLKDRASELAVVVCQLPIFHLKIT